MYSMFIYPLSFLMNLLWTVYFANLKTVFCSLTFQLDAAACHIVILKSQVGKFSLRMGLSPQSTQLTNQIERHLGKHCVPGVLWTLKI